MSFTAEIAGTESKADWTELEKILATASGADWRELEKTWAAGEPTENSFKEENNEYREG
jgi:hypothetical protein